MRLAPMALLLALLCTASLAVAADWLPLTPGMRWEYRASDGAHQVQTITGQMIVHGRLISMKSYAEAPDVGLTNFWSLDPDGSVRLSGFFRSVEGFGRVYDPPILMLKTPPVLGLQPYVFVNIYDYLLDTPQGSFPLAYSVNEFVTLSVPAGAFACAGVGQAVTLPAPPTASGRSFSADGRDVTAFAKSIYLSTTTDWFSEGVGFVQYQGPTPFQLVGYGLPTPVAKASWGRVKALFR